MMGMDETNDNNRMDLILALNYSSRWEILHAINQIARDAASGILDLPIGEAGFNQYLSTHGIPDPELMIRTSGEYRISNFLLWQAAYTELHFTLFLARFHKTASFQAIQDYQGRQRRFGKTEEQLKI